MDSETLYNGFFAGEVKAARFAYSLAYYSVKKFYKETPDERDHQGRRDEAIEELAIKVIEYFFKNGPDFIKEPKAFIDNLEKRAWGACFDHAYRSG